MNARKFLWITPENSTQYWATTPLLSNPDTFFTKCFQTYILSKMLQISLHLHLNVTSTTKNEGLESGCRLPGKKFMHHFQQNPFQQNPNNEALYHTTSFQLLKHFYEQNSSRTFCAYQKIWSCSNAIRLDCTL